MTSKHITQNIKVGNQRYIMSSDDEYLHHMGAEFEPHMTRLFSALIRPEDVVLDVGANIGLTALLFSQLARSVHAFEPSPSTYAFLSENIARAGAKNVVTLHNVGLGAEESTSTIAFNPANRSGGFVTDTLNDIAGHHHETVTVRQGDQYLDGLHVDFVKIDVEGYELHVVRGLAETLRDSQPCVVLEMNHWCLNAFQRVCIPDFLDELKSIFPIVIAVDGDHCVDLADATATYSVMYEHILKFRYQNLICAFEWDRLSEFSNHFT